MKSHADTKLKITGVVANYERDNYDEYVKFLAARKIKTEGLKSHFGDMTKHNNYIERLLYEIPETLSNLFDIKLDDDDKAFLRSKEGGLWFAKAFRQYTVPEKV